MNDNYTEVTPNENKEVQAVPEENKTKTAKAPAKTGKAVKKSIYTKLLAIQTTLKAPKNLYNNYGKYNYRNAEGILEAVKPYLAEQECILIMEDEIVTVGEETVTKTQNDGTTVSKLTPRRYVKATAHFIDCESGEELKTSAYANECDHTGMSGDQCTGTASSYARKYCLNALFLLDDTKDSDTDEMKNIENSAKQSGGNSAAQSSSQSNWGNKGQQNTQQSDWGNQQKAQPSGWGKTPAQNEGRTWGK